MELDLDSAEGEFERLRQLAVFGETWVNPDENTVRYRPDEYPWNRFRASGRGWGSATTLVQWIDEMAQACAAAEERDAVLRDVAARGLTPPKADDTPVTIRWACLKPTDAEGEVVHVQGQAFSREELGPGFGDLLQMWLEKR